METRVATVSDGPGDFSDAFQLRLFEFIGFEVFECLSHRGRIGNMAVERLTRSWHLLKAIRLEANLVQIVECYFRMNLHHWRIQCVCEEKVAFNEERFNDSKTIEISR